MDFKKQAAAKAVTFIKDQTTVGLGAGATMIYLAELLAEEVKKGLQVKVLTSSFSTQQVLTDKAFAVRHIADISELDIYFDGCDQLDKELNALKSGGGIHTREKLLASMAREFFLVGDDSKYSEYLDTRFPLVIELLPEALHFVPVSIQKIFPGVRNVLRINDKRDGPVITGNGNYLLDVWFTAWPELEKINPLMKGITGVVETSLFYKLAHKAILAGNDGIKILERTQ